MDKKAFYRLSSGLYLVSTAFDGKDNGCIINTALQVTSTPAQISVTINKENYTEQLIEKSGVFSVQALNEDADMDVIGVFGFKSGKDIEKFADISFKRDENGVPYITEKAAARFSCRVVNKMDVGTHVIFVGEVIDAEVMEGDPMTYAYYRQVKKGGTPAKASSYHGDVKEDEKSAGRAKGWRCSICGYVYEGEELPADFVCPVCGAPVSVFEKL